ncbi:MAG: hypothetical protein R3Y12_02040 [Clostridia bacterium]
MSRGGPPRGGGGPRGGGPRGGRPPMSRSSSSMGRPPMNHSRANMGRPPMMNTRGPMGRPPSPYGRRGNPFASLMVFAIILVASAVSALGDNILWITLIIGVVAVIGMFLFYKYNKDRAEAFETNQMLNSDLETFGNTNQEVEDLAEKYK